MFRTSQTKKKAGRFCCAYACENKPIDKKGGLCHKHFARKRREEDPVGTRYLQFKGNARTRNKVFTITPEQFNNFCEENQYIVKKGRRGQNATIDRIKNKFGYHIWNIQILTNRRNASKGTSDCPF